MAAAMALRACETAQTAATMATNVAAEDVQELAEEVQLSAAPAQEQNVPTAVPPLLIDVGREEHRHAQNPDDEADCRQEQETTFQLQPKPEGLASEAAAAEPEVVVVAAKEAR